MENTEDLKTEIKKLNAKATKAKMDLHDLAEDLPIGWENILQLATDTYAAYRDLTAAKERLSTLPRE